jgi:hypothetical protein
MQQKKNDTPTLSLRYTDGGPGLRLHFESAVHRGRYCQPLPHCQTHQLQSQWQFYRYYTPLLVELAHPLSVFVRNGTISSVNSQSSTDNREMLDVVPLVAVSLIFLQSTECAIMYELAQTKFSAGIYVHTEVYQHISLLL